MPKPGKLRDMLLRMYRIRLFEERLSRLYDYRGFYGGELTDDPAAGGEDLLTCMLYDFASEGMIGGAVHLYIGEEAVAVGICSELRDTDFITSYHRGHGHAIAKGLDLHGMLAELMGRETGHSRGCGGSMHIYNHGKGMLGGNGIIGGQIPLALGAAFAAKYRGEDGVAVAFFGDGAANQGTFGECLNLASLWQLPVLFVCENNLWAASTAAEVAHCCPDLAPRAEPYGIPAEIVDGQDVLAVNAVAREAVERARAGQGPTMIEAKTFRFVGHAGAGQGAHRDPEAVEQWKQRDPLMLFERRLTAMGVMCEDEMVAMRAEVSAELDRVLAQACADPFPTPESLETLDGPPIEAPADAPSVAKFRHVEPVRRPVATMPAEPTREAGWGQLVAEALREEMERDERVYLIGEDLGPVTEREHLWEQLRERRVFQTPISEAAFVGVGTGSAATGLRPVVEIMYMDFVAVCFDQIVNQCAPLKLMSGGRISVPMVIKTPAGCGSREAAHHSGHHEAWFMHAPGLKVAIPSNAYDAKGLLKTAIRDDEPVLFVEHRLLRRSTMAVPEGGWLVPFGEAAVRREGSDITVVATSYAVTKALRAARALEGEISVEVVDPRTLVPLDVATILGSLAKTGRLLIVHEAPTRAGAGAEIMRRIMEDGGFELLKTAPRVLARADTPMPYSPPLEDAVLPQSSDIAAAIRAMVRG